MTATFASHIPHAFGVLAVLLLVRIARLTSRWRSRARGLRLPPGPRGYPIIGNLLDVPRHYPWNGYREMAKIYGDLVYLNVLGQNIVVVGSFRLASEWLDKHAANSSDRPVRLVTSLIGADWILPLMAYGQSWRVHRRLFWQYFQPNANKRYLPVQREECHGFLVRLLENLGQLEDELLFMLASSILRTVYNIRLQGLRDPITDALQVSAQGVAQSLVPGSSFVEVIPALRFLPSWLPFQRRIKHWREGALNMKELPFSQAQRGSVDTTDASVLDLLLKRMSESADMSQAEGEEIAKDVAGIAYAGGVETVWATLQSFFLAMSLYPEVQKKAQAELDLVVGTNRLPNFDDEEQLPYVSAVVKEVLRWQPVLPIGIPHATVDDDEFNGYFIPAGTAIIPNVWAMTHDPAVYPEPDRFMPERFLKDGELDPNVRDPGSITFGFGRRICAGRYFAHSVLFITVASVLAVYDTSPRLDSASGQPIRVQPKLTDGVISHPEDCRCSIKPRSDEARALILRASSSRD